MGIQGWYYLHTNGSLIYKRELGGTAADIRESPFARSMWPLDPQDRETVWRVLVEALALGADKPRVDELAKLWQCDDADADSYAQRIGCELFLDGDAWCATDRHVVNLQESPAGFGATKLEAMAALCKELGYKGGKTWAATFADLLNRRENSQYRTPYLEVGKAILAEASSLERAEGGEKQEAVPNSVEPVLECGHASARITVNSCYCEYCQRQQRVVKLNTHSHPPSPRRGKEGGAEKEAGPGANNAHGTSDTAPLSLSGEGGVPLHDAWKHAAALNRQDSAPAPAPRSMLGMTSEEIANVKSILKAPAGGEGLKACPFCGGRPEKHIPLEMDRDVSCVTEGCPIQHRPIDRSAWNTRTPAPLSPDAGEVVKRLRREAETPANDYGVRQTCREAAATIEAQQAETDRYAKNLLKCQNEYNVAFSRATSAEEQLAGALERETFERDVKLEERNLRLAAEEKLEKVGAVVEAACEYLRCNPGEGGLAKQELREALAALSPQPSTLSEAVRKARGGDAPKPPRTFA